MLSVSANQPDEQHHHHVELQEQDPPEFFERHLARLLVVLYFCGQPVNHMLEGQVRQVDSIARLQQFDFWMREPGHLALALMRSYTSNPERLEEITPNLRTSIDRMLQNDDVDVHRVRIPNATHGIFEDLDYSLSHLTARALVSDRPSFARSRQFTHQVVLEAAGVALVEKIFAEAPSFDWYRKQGELIAAYFSRLERYDLAVMSYLSPTLTPVTAGVAPLAPYIRQRYDNTFGELRIVDF
jgi:hypothetical protein